MTQVMPRIDTIVMLMLENRSLDTVLGWAHDDDEIKRNGPVFIVPPESAARFDGIRPGMGNSRRFDEGIRTYRPSHGTQDFRQAMRVPRADPWEDIANVWIQMYADEDGPPATTSWEDDAPMTGFAYDYPVVFDPSGEGIGEVMGAYTRDQLPVLYGLAENFAVSDAWFCSVPTMTDPNRAFSICGTSEGITSDTLRTFDAPTIFNGLDDAGVEWGIYWQYNGWLDGDPTILSRTCWTVDRFSQIGKSLHEGNGHVGPYKTDFFDQLDRGTLPRFSYVEPHWGWGLGFDDGDDFLGLQGNDYHPPTWVGPAEFDLNHLYERLKCSPQWSNMLFVISFDEHGGTWDHVSPPRARAPDLPASSKDEFEFTRLGPRVPTLLVSPYVVPRTIFRPRADAEYPFDHSSLIATILAWAGTSEEFIESMGPRVVHAPLFDHALSNEPYDHNTPCFTVPPEYAQQGGGQGPHGGWPVDLRYLPWDGLRSIVADFSAENPLTKDEFIELVRALHPPPASGR